MRPHTDTSRLPPPSQARGMELLPRPYRDAVINGLHTMNSTSDFHGTFHMLVFMSEAAENHHAVKSFNVDLHVAEWEFFGKRGIDGSSDCKVAASCWWTNARDKNCQRDYGNEQNKSSLRAHALPPRNVFAACSGTPRPRVL